MILLREYASGRAVVRPLTSLIAVAAALIGGHTLAQQASATTGEPPLQEIVVTGSRIAAPNEVSTSPIQVVTSKDIQVYGKTDITDIINLLPQIFTNDLGQDLGNGTNGLTTAGGVATADLRGTPVVGLIVTPTSSCTRIW